MTNIILDIILILATVYIMYVTIRSLRTGVAPFRYGTVRRNESPFMYWFDVIKPLILLVLVWVYVIILSSKK